MLIDELSICPNLLSSVMDAILKARAMLWQVVAVFDYILLKRKGISERKLPVILNAPFRMSLRPCLINVLHRYKQISFISI